MKRLLVGLLAVILLLLAGVTVLAFRAVQDTPLVTGDGVLSAVVIAEIVARTGRPLADLADAAMTRLPQVLRNVRIEAPMPDVTVRIADELTAAAAALGADGRVLVRPSGTEPVVRVMVEAVDAVTAQEWCDHLVQVVESL